MADFLDEKRKEIDSRLKELRPLVDEFNRLEKAAAALAGVGGTTNGSSSSGTRRRRSSGGSARKGRVAALAAAGHGQSRRWSWCAPARG